MTETREDYLRAIYYLEGKNSVIKAVDIARYLNLRKSTVTERLQALAENNFISYERYGKIKLLQKGRTIAKELTKKHRLIEVFLYQLLHRPKDKVHEEAHKLEHAFSSDSIKALQKLLGNPQTDPHGQPIPQQL